MYSVEITIVNNKVVTYFYIKSKFMTTHATLRSKFSVSNKLESSSLLPVIADKSMIFFQKNLKRNKTYKPLVDQR
jgi:hypothetical protein